jgi:SPX domain protein involved in polyphosphate accumulation
MIKNITTSSVTQFQRVELKYVISNNLVDILIPELLNHLGPDSFSKEGFYEIYSVYFDTQDYQAFYSKMDGNSHRKKYRIRSYYPNPKADEEVFLEVKEKSDNTVSKRRTPIPFGAIPDLQQGIASPKDTPVAREWRYALIKNSLKPKLLNSYRRMAFISEHFPGLRVTIDRDIKYSMTNTVDFDLPTRNVLWSHQYTIIEIKFDRYVPQFIVEMLRRHNLSKEPVSKYCNSVMSNYLLL